MVRRPHRFFSPFVEGHPRCPACGKVGWPTEAEAEVILFEVNRRRGKIETRVYWCDLGKQYHLTSMEEQSSDDHSC
jgi:hypothetical protein